MTEQLPAERKCPDCKETILQDANVCKHCGKKFFPKWITRAAILFMLAPFLLMGGCLIAMMFLPKKG